MSHSFTIKHNNIVNSIISDIIISKPERDKEIVDRLIKHSYKAIWDTGATNSVITSKVVADLGILPTGQTIVNTASGETIQNTHEVNIYLPNYVYSTFVTVTECNSLTSQEDNIEVLIGMDIISRGDFSITNFNNVTWFTFRMPSSHQIDYVEEHNRNLIKTMNRNDKCYCGSGKKFKNCHLPLISKK